MMRKYLKYIVLQDKTILGPKMRSTGETFGMDRDKEQSILKSYLGNYPNLLGPGKLLISLANKNKTVLLPYLKNLYHLDILLNITTIV